VQCAYANFLIHAITRVNSFRNKTANKIAAKKTHSTHNNRNYTLALMRVKRQWCGVVCAR